jgi:hypothetical protein
MARILVSLAKDETQRQTSAPQIRTHAWLDLQGHNQPLASHCQARRQRAVQNPFNGE